MGDISGLLGVSKSLLRMIQKKGYELSGHTPKNTNKPDNMNHSNKPKYPIKPIQQSLKILLSLLSLLPLLPLLPMLLLLPLLPLLSLLQALQRTADVRRHASYPNDYFFYILLLSVLTQLEGYGHRVSTGVGEIGGVNIEIKNK